MKTISIELLRDLCLKHDVEYDPYPEDRYEGEAIFDFILDKIDEQTYSRSTSEWQEDLRKMYKNLQEKREEK